MKEALVSGMLIVHKAPLSIMAHDASRPYGDANPLFGGAILGIRNDDSISASFTAAADVSSDVGTYSIVPAAVDSVPPKLGNYDVVLNNGTLTVTQAPLTITADSNVRLYGDSDPTFTGVISGTRNGDAITASYATTATVATPIGDYAIVPYAVDSVPPKLLNYAANQVAATLTINKAPLSIQADDKTKSSGSPNPPLTGVISGIKNLDPISAVYSTAANTSSPPGVYPIVPAAVDSSPPKLGNYELTLVNGTLTVEGGFETVTAVTGTSPNPAGVGQSVAISFTVSSLPPGGTLTGNVSVSDGTRSCTAAISAGYCRLAFGAAGFVTLTATYAGDQYYGGSTSSGYSLVVYDPNAGSVTGGGWYPSPAGAYVPDPSMTSRMWHAISAKYIKGGSIPQGDVYLKLDGVLELNSTSLDWLVISGTNFFIQGTGKVKGRAGSYGFWYVGAGADTDHESGRVRLWYKSNGQLLYDSQPSDPVWAFPAIPLGGGDFTIHRGPNGSGGGRME